MASLSKAKLFCSARATIRSGLLAVLFAMLSSNVCAADQSAVSATRSDEVQQEQEQQPVVDEVEALKQEVIELNRDLFILEEDLLFPATTQFAVFMSVDVGAFFILDSVELKIDGQTVTHYLYTEKQVSALHKGGVQRLYTGNLKSGEHELTAFVTGKGPNERSYKLGATRVFTKGTDITSLELQLRDSTNKYQPEFSVVEWE